MLVERWSSEIMPKNEQFEAARAKLLGSPAPVRLERPGVPSDAPFPISMAVHAFASHVVAVHTRGAGAHGFRTPAEIARGAPEMAWLIQYRDSNGLAVLDGDPFPIKAGDIVYGDCGVTMGGEGPDLVDYTMWMVPRAALRPLLDDPDGDPRGVVSRHEPLGRLAGAHLALLSGALERLDGQGTMRLLDHLATLLSLARGAARDQGERTRAVLDDVRLVAIRRDVRSRYSDPRLSAASVAARHAMSVRTLHALFEPTGVSFGRFVLDVRLAAVLEQLSRPGARRVGVAHIAFGCGFDSLSTFYRAFRARYACSPRERMMER